MQHKLMFLSAWITNTTDTTTAASIMNVSIKKKKKKSKLSLSTISRQELGIMKTARFVATVETIWRSGDHALW